MGEHPDNGRSVPSGRPPQDGVITAAATIMIRVFRSFLFGAGPRSRFGIGLASAVFLDAFVLRTVLVPSLMHLFGKSNW